MARPLSLFFLLLAMLGCSTPRSPEVVVYCALDQVYSEPVLRDFEQASGIRVKARYDLEATKTTGLVNLILAEKDRPACDVFWNNEMLQTVVLQQAGVLEPYKSPSAEGIPAKWRDPEGYWTGFAARIRVIMYNRDQVEGDPPRSLEDLTDPRWKGRAAFAKPLFGTTLSHVVCLDQVLGAEKTGALLDGMGANEVQIVDGNSVVKDRVAAGEAAWGYTDSDDANLAVLAGAPVEVVVPDQEGPGTLLIPNTVALVRGGPNPEAARRLVDHLLSAAVEERLARSDSLQIPLHEGVRGVPATPDPARIRTLDPDLRKAAELFPKVLDQLRGRFVR